MRETAPLAGVWSTLCKVLAGLAEEEDQPRFLERCLDDLLGLFGADRAVILLHHEDGSVSCPCSRTRGRALSEVERVAISRTVTRRALETGHVITANLLDEVDPAESLVWKGIFLAMAAPMRPVRWEDGRPSRTTGVLYVDFRDRRRVVSDADRAFLQAVAHVLGAALVPYRQLERARIQLSDMAALPVAEEPSLEELLRYDSMSAVRAELASAVGSDAPILILGQSGTGKTQLARAIAVASGRAPIVRAVLGSSDDLNTITSELFGHERGSFSGALGKRTGLVEFADGGTLIFDEILNLPPSAQQLLLDFTQFGSYRPLGHDRREPKRARVRLIAATNGDLATEIRRQRFREDLYYRLASVVIELPPLRDRRAEVPDLAASILARYRLPNGRSSTLAPDARALLSRPDWAFSGNVRQLEAATRRARDRALTEGSAAIVEARHFSARDLSGLGPAWEPPTVTTPAPAPSIAAPRTAPHAATLADLDEQRRALELRERDLVVAALERSGGVIAHAAKELRVARTTLASRLDALGIQRPPSRPSRVGPPKR